MTLQQPCGKSIEGEDAEGRGSRRDGDWDEDSVRVGNSERHLEAEGMGVGVAVRLAVDTSGAESFRVLG